MTDDERTPTSLYRYYDKRGILLYVGITGRGATRNHEHNLSKEWWRYVFRQEVEHYPSRRQAADVERATIRRYRPPYNTQHNPGHEQTRAVYEAVRTSGVSTQLIVEAATRGTGKRIAMDVHRSADLAVLTAEDRVIRRIECPDTKKIHVANGRLIDVDLNGDHVTIRVRVRRSIEVASASLMFRHEQAGRLSIKRIDLEKAA